MKDIIIPLAALIIGLLIGAYLLPKLGIGRSSNPNSSVIAVGATDPIPDPAIDNQVYRLYRGKGKDFILRSFDIATNFGAATKGQSATFIDGTDISISHDATGIKFKSGIAAIPSGGFQIILSQPFPKGSTIQTDAKGIFSITSPTGTPVPFSFPVGKLISINNGDTSIVVGYVDQSDVGGGN